MAIKNISQLDDAGLRTALINAAEGLGFDLEDDWTHAAYSQDTNDDALSDAWLDKGSSYIWRVGTLSIWDANKCDWCGLVFGQRRDPDRRPEVIGSARWDDGENDDPARTFVRALTAAAMVHPVFHYETD